MLISQLVNPTFSILDSFFTGVTKADVGDRDLRAVLIDPGQRIDRTRNLRKAKRSGNHRLIDPIQPLRLRQTSNNR